MVQPWPIDRLEEPAAPELGKLLAERTDGNPFFAEQLLTPSARGEACWPITAGDGRLALRSPGVRPDAERHPPPLHRARLDRLAWDVRELVQTAAVLGREFNLGWLGRMLPDEPDLAGKVAAAEAAAVWTGLNRLAIHIPQRALLRDVAYEMLLQARRRDLHYLAAQTLKALHQKDQTPVLAELAYHYETAYRQGLDELREPASDYLRRAGEQAAAEFENETAIDYYNRALELTPEEKTITRYDLILAREAVLDYTGDREAQRADLATLSDLTAALADPAREATVYLRRAFYGLETSDYPAAIVAAQMALAQAEVAGDLALQAAALGQWGFALWRQDEHGAAREQLEMGLELSRAGGARREEAHCLISLGVVRETTNDITGGEAAFQAGLAICREIGDRYAEMRALNNLGRQFQQTG